MSTSCCSAWRHPRHRESALRKLQPFSLPLKWLRLRTSILGQELGVRTEETPPVLLPRNASLQTPQPSELLSSAVRLGILHKAKGQALGGVDAQSCFATLVETRDSSSQEGYRHRETGEGILATPSALARRLL